MSSNQDITLKRKYIDEIYYGKHLSASEKEHYLPHDRMLEMVGDFGDLVMFLYNDGYKLTKEILEVAFIKYPHAISLMDESLQVEALKSRSQLIKYIDKPSETVQLEAVKQNGLAIQFINNPSETVQLEVVKENCFAIMYIDNPSETVRLEAVKQHGFAIKYIDNPSEAVQLEALNSYWDILLYNPIMDLGEKSDWFQREVNRLKLLNGPLE